MVWTAIDRLLIIWQFDLSDKRKWDFFQTVAVLILLYGCTSAKWILNKNMQKKVKWELYKDTMCVLFWTNPGSNTPQNNSCTVTYFPSHKPSKTCGALLKKHGQTHKWCSTMSSYTWTCQCWLTSIDLH